MTRAIRAIAICILAASASLPALALPKHYTYVDLGVSSSYVGISAAAINDSGRIAGLYTNPFERAFTWQRDTGFTDLGTLGGTKSNAYGINTDGTIVGQAYDPTGVYRPFIRRPGSAMTDLGTLGGQYGSARDINDAGQVVGTATTSGGYNRAFIWQDGHPMQALGTMGGITNEAWGINNSGTVVGTEYTGQIDRTGYITQAFVWDTGAGMRRLPGLGGNRDVAYAVNDFGLAVGSSEIKAYVSRAVLWSGISQARDLGTIAGLTDSTSCGRSINNHGQVVGRSSNSNKGMSAFIWEDGAGMTDLNTLVTNLPANVWLTDASAINSSGWISGLSSAAPGESRLYVLIPNNPEPESFLVLAAGLVSLATSTRIARTSRKQGTQDRRCEYK